MPTAIAFQDGPCAGESTSVTPTILARGWLTCGGATYNLQALAPNLYVAYETSSSSSFDLAAIAPDVLGGWDDVRRTLGATVPAQLARAQRLLGIARRSLGPRRKVRR